MLIRLRFLRELRCVVVLQCEIRLTVYSLLFLSFVLVRAVQILL